MKLLTSGSVEDHPYFEQFSAYFKALEEGISMKHTDLSSALKTHEVMHLAMLSLKFKRNVFMHEIQRF